MRRAEELHQVADLYIWLSTRLNSFPDRKQAEQFQNAICELIDVSSSPFQTVYPQLTTLLQSDLAQMPSPRQQKKMQKQMKNKFRRKRKHNRRMERSHLRAGRWDQAGDEVGLYDP